MSNESAASANPADTAAAPRWWSLAACLFAAGFGAVVLVTVGVLAQGNWLGGPPTITIPMSAFDVARGHASPSGTALVIDAVDATQTAIVSARVAPFAAASYSRVDWKILPTVEPRPALALAWVTREQPGRTLVKPLQWLEAGVAPLEVTAADGWVGTITGLALVVRGPLPQPVVVQGVALPGISAASMAREVLDQWAERRPWGGSAVTYPFDAERDQHLSLPAAAALALALAGIGYVALARKRRWPLDARVFFALFLGGWLLLDARWQVNLWRQRSRPRGSSPAAASRRSTSRPPTPRCTHWRRRCAAPCPRRPCASSCCPTTWRCGRGGLLPAPALRQRLLPGRLPGIEPARPRGPARRRLRDGHPLHRHRVRPRRPRAGVARRPAPRGRRILYKNDGVALLRIR